MFRKIDHIGIAVRSLEAACAFYSNELEMELKAIEVVAEQGVRVAQFRAGEGRLELLEPVGEESPVARFLARRGEGIHHICLEVGDISAEIERLRAAGVRLIDEVPRRGAHGCLIAFIHPSATGGVLIEISQSGSSTDAQVHE